MKSIIFLSLLFSQVLFSQELIHTDIQGKNIKYFIDLEHNLKSEIYKSKEMYISPNDVDQPIIFRRKENEIPDLLVYYTFYKKDSTISEILYEWDIYNFEKQDKNKKSLTFDKKLINKYNSIVEEISEKYGKGRQEEDLENLSLLSTERGLYRKDDWQVNENLTVNSSINLSEFYNKEGNITTNPTHRIRVYVTNNNDKKLPEIYKDKIIQYDIYFNHFLDYLKKNDFNSARIFLSDKIKTSVSDEVLKNLSGQIKINQKKVIFMTGFETLMDGKNYPMLQYKYSDDISLPPTEYIVVLFEEDGKILGIRPLKNGE